MCLCVLSQPSSQQDATRELSKSTFFINALNHKQRYSNITENGANPPACTRCYPHLPLCLSCSSVFLNVSLHPLFDYICNDQHVLKQHAGERSISESTTCLVPRTPPQGPKVCLV